MNLSKNVFIHFAGKLIPALSQLVILIFGVRLLGTAEFGKYNLLYSTSMVISSLMVGWIQQSLLRFFFEMPGSPLSKAFDFYKLVIPAALISFVLTFVVCIIYFDASFFELLVVSSFTMLFSVFLVLLTMKQVRLEPIAYARIESFFYAITIIIFFSAIYFYSIRNSIIIFNGMLISLVICLSFILIQSGNLLKTVKGFRETKTRKDFFMKMFKYGAPITIWLLISNLYNVFDRYIINYYLGYDSVGIYGSVYDLIYKIGGFMTLPVLLTYHPAISRAWSEQEYEKVKNLIYQALSYELLIMLVIFLGIYFLSDELFQLIFNKKIEKLNWLFVPIALSAVLWQVALIIQKPLEFNFRQKTMIIGIIVTVLMNGLLNIITVPRYGFIVSGFNTLICTTGYFLFVLYNSRTELKLKLLKLSS